MKIRHIAIKNYSNVKDFGIDIDGHVVFVGPNSIGKSSILQMLDVTLGYSKAQLEKEMATKIVFRNDKMPMTCRVVLSNFTPEELAFFIKDKILPEKSQPKSEITVEVEVALSSTDSTVIKVNRNIVIKDTDPISVSPSLLKGFNWQLIKAHRKVDQDLSLTSSGALIQLLEGNNLMGDKKVAKAFKQLDAAIKSTKTICALRSAIADAVTITHPSNVSPDKIDIQLSTDLKLLKSLNVSIQQSNSSDTRLLTDLSDGMQSLTAVAFQFRDRGEGQITAIDEPEAHLDIRSQARIGELFASTDGQRIIATHSPAVVREFKPSEVAVITNDGVQQIKSNMVSENPKFLSQWWTEDMIEPLTSNSLILVEGPADKILIRKVAELLGKDLNSLSVSVMALNGKKNFTKAFEFFGSSGFNIKLSALIDCDGEGARCTNDQEPRACCASCKEMCTTVSDTNAVVTCCADLEEEYVDALKPERAAELLKNAGINLNKDEDALQWCRRGKNKVEAALAIADGLTKKEAESITPLKKLIERATSP